MRYPRLFVQTMITLTAASLGLVAALTWNEANKATIKRVMGSADELARLSLYPVVATVLAVFVLIWRARLAARLGGEVAFEREAEG